MIVSAALLGGAWFWTSFEKKMEPRRDAALEVSPPPQNERAAAGPGAVSTILPNESAGKAAGALPVRVYNGADANTAAPQPLAQPAATAPPLVAGKMFDPLPDAPPADVKQQFVDAERNLRIEQLLKEAAAAKQPREAHRILLTVAGYQVGKGDWKAAKEIYQKIVADANDPDVLLAVARNLEVVN